MMISRKKLYKIIREGISRLIKEMSISADEAEAYLRDRAASYKRDGLQGRGMKMLLQDDFIDDLGHQHAIEDFEWLIDELINDNNSELEYASTLPMQGPRTRGASPPRGIPSGRGMGESVKITKRQLRRIIREQKANLLNEIDFVSFDFPHMKKDAYSKLEDLIMAHMPLEADFLREEEFATFEKIVIDALAEMKDRVVRDFSGEIV